MKKFAKTLGMALAWWVCAVLALSCQKSDSPAASGLLRRSNSGVFRILARLGTQRRARRKGELKFGQSQGVKVVLEYSGSLDTDGPPD